MKKRLSVGIDLGGTNLRAALVSEDGSVMKKFKAPSVEDIEGSLLASIGEVFTDGVIGIGIGVAGLIDRAEGAVMLSPNIPLIEGVKIVELVKERFQVPVFI